MLPVAQPRGSSNQNVETDGESEDVGEDMETDIGSKTQEPEPSPPRFPEMQNPVPGPSTSGPLNSFDSATVNLLLHKCSVLEKENKNYKKMIEKDKETVKLLREKVKSLISDKSNLRQKVNREQKKFEGKVKVEKILKGSLDSIPSPSPSVEIKIMGRKG